MVRPHDLVVSLSDIDRDDSRYVGGKAANLGEMIGAKFPVPPGFAVTTAAYNDFLKENGFDKKIERLITTINFESDDSLNQVSRELKKIIQTGEISEKLANEIFMHYEKLGKNILVAIRSSAVGEDSKEASYAGQNETFLDIRGEAVLADKIREAWASLFSPRSIFYRHERRHSNTKTGIALVVQKMVEADASGVIFTVDPVTEDKSKITLEAIFGLGEYIVQGKVTPDHYEVDKKNLQIIKKVKNPQMVMLKKVEVGDREVKVPLMKRNSQKITDHEIIALTKLAVAIEKHYYFPQDIEWAKEKDKIYIVQTRPITTLSVGKNSKQEAKSHNTYGNLNLKLLMVGEGASPGIAYGPVRKIRSEKELSKVKQGDVLVAEFTNPDYVTSMKKSSAIVTEKGGRTSHAAIVTREFGIPSVVGASGVLSRLKENEIITVNGKTGEIYRGASIGLKKTADDKFSSLKTTTKLLVNLAEPELASGIALRNVDGVGLLRAEFMIAQIGVHPKKAIHDKKSKEFINKLAEGIATICQAFYPRPVLYRATDFKTNEYRNLTGGRYFEPEESNPSLGFRGAFRYIHDPQVFNLELEAIKKVREKLNLNNLSLMLPYVRTVRELEEVKKIITAGGLRRSGTFKLFIMAEIPSNVILIDAFINAGIDGVSIGTNDLTMLILGTDRDNQEVSSEFDERNPAVLWAIKRVIDACKKNKIEVSICGGAPSVFPAMIEELVKWGINSISVFPDAIDDARRIIYFQEKRMSGTQITE